MISGEYTPKEVFKNHREKYNILKKENIVDDENIKFFTINRSDLDDIIKIAYIIKNNDMTNAEKIFVKDDNNTNGQDRDMQNHEKIKFYDLDMDALIKMQYDYDFIILGTSGFYNSGRAIIYQGIIFEDNMPTNKQAHLIINDVDSHLSSVRFAFSAYELMHRNSNRYSILAKNKGIKNDARIIMRLDKYFEYTLKKYITY